MMSDFDHKPAPHQPLPFGLRWLRLETFVLAVQGWGRAGVVINDIERYERLVKAPAAPLYIGVSILGGLCFTLLTWGLLRRKWWAIRWLWPILAVYAIFALGWLALFAQGPGEKERLPFLVGLTLAGLFVNLLLIKRRRMQAAFHPQSTED